MHCTGPLSLSCPTCGGPAEVAAEALSWRHAGSWEPSLIVVERFVAPVALPCGHEALVRLEASDGMGGPGLRVLVAGEPLDAPGLRLWFGPGGVPLEEP